MIVVAPADVSDCLRDFFTLMPGITFRIAIDTRLLPSVGLQVLIYLWLCLVGW